MNAKSLIFITMLVSAALCATAAPGKSASAVPIVKERTGSVGVGCASAYSVVDSEGRPGWNIDYTTITDYHWVDVSLPDITGVTKEDITETINVDLAKGSCKTKAECRGNIDIKMTSYVHQNSSSSTGFVFSSKDSFSGKVGSETMNPPQSSTNTLYYFNGGKLSTSTAIGFNSFNATPFTDPAIDNLISLNVTLNGKNPTHGVDLFLKGGCASQMVNGTQLIFWKTSQVATIKGLTPTSTTSKALPTSTSPSTGKPNSAASSTASLFLSLFVPATFLFLFA
eukprot:Nk52_evm21s1837 gene=Nk52_evmTU21s1837